MPDKVVLVTGAAGFIGGKTLHPLLDLGYEVHGVSHKGGVDVPRVQWHSCDLLNPVETEKLLARVRPSHLLHTAWHTEHGKFWTAPENTMWLEASADLFKKFTAQGGKRILGIGSCAEYDWQRKNKALWKETDLCRPHTPYGRAKLALLEKLSALDASYAWARLFLLFGPDEKPERLVPYAIRTALGGETVRCSEGTQIRDFIDTRICGRALAQVLDSDVTGVINIGSGETMSVADLVKKICTLCGYPENIKLGAVPMNKDDPPFMVPDLSRLHNEVKFAEHQDTSRALSDLISMMRQY